MCKQDSANQLFKQGMQQVRKGHLQEAMQSFIQFTRESPKSNLADNAYYNLGICSKELKDYVKAAVFFKIVLMQYPDSDAASMAKDQLEDLQNLMDPAAELFIGAEQAMIEDRLDNAWQGFTRVTEKHPESSLADNALFSLGMIARRRGDHKLSQQIFDRLKELYPDSDAAKSLADIV